MEEYLNFRIKFLDDEVIQIERCRLETDLDGWWYFQSSLGREYYSIQKSQVKYCVTEDPR